MTDPRPQRLIRRVRALLGAAEALVLPATCGGCGQRGVWLCEQCRAQLRPVPEPTCRCGRPADAAMGSHGCRDCRDWPPGLRSMQSAFLFDGPLRSSIHRFKYQSERARGEFLGRLLADRAAELVDRWGGVPQLILPIPLHPKRQRERGFNQADVLARAVGTRLDVPVGHGLLRTAETRSQVGLGHLERRVNMRGAFSCQPGAVAGISILLIDDVVTTGATTEEAARTLLRAGAARVDALSLARQF